MAFSTYDSGRYQKPKHKVACRAHRPLTSGDNNRIFHSPHKARRWSLPSSLILYNYQLLFGGAPAQIQLANDRQSLSDFPLHLTLNVVVVVSNPFRAGKPTPSPFDLST
ncbi:hypothetical protein TNCV_4798381 [Trichonephila clavipes]|nr:hypothetical protein TNCV_4798381 [Trichonephila clavipes]